MRAGTLPRHQEQSWDKDLHLEFPPYEDGTLLFGHPNIQTIDTTGIEPAPRPSQGRMQTHYTSCPEERVGLEPTKPCGLLFSKQFPSPSGVALPSLHRTNRRVRNRTRLREIWSFSVVPTNCTPNIQSRRRESNPRGTAYEAELVPSPVHSAEALIGVEPTHTTFGK